MTKDQPAYDYADYDGAYFRRPAGNGPYTEVWKKSVKQWGPYTGSGTKIAMYGDAVHPDDLPPGAVEPGA